MSTAEKIKAKQLLLSSQEKSHAYTDIGSWDFEGREAELVVGHVDDDHKREVCQEILGILAERGFAMTKGYHLPNSPLPHHTSNYRFDAPIGGLQDAFYLRLNKSDLEEICTALKKLGIK